MKGVTVPFISHTLYLCVTGSEGVGMRWVIPYNPRVSISTGETIRSTLTGFYTPLYSVLS